VFFGKVSTAYDNGGGFVSGERPIQGGPFASGAVVLQGLREKDFYSWSRLGFVHAVDI